ncbi:sn-glycerol-3-phosphate ABC transporter ATP-binding protein UgpC [Brucella pituitosa]|uniref:ABC transporter ATP-binding protein n=1 Tax=Brucella TaxID=234 RepID=UPI0004668503|nr:MULTISPECIES: sn-glycerol-3-phosphate ABC transporter ATP-binding protein UgpC [Brucella]PQZ50322.1 ABC transporter ATP-binding protein [Ochrobactrum sp. MYb19]PRA55288.1 ABC transporter ATP-binding protein [Ochrobactrum sp. MYb68]PRA68363.1 ABC transporter ATP-binding protein [Ochrobactrum sp. MYb18]PRA74410.1 ABC transporter ATP-binding protein [Brucella thiophenivorans]PRA86511.1 ABC transporter ATP-binding protein [Ochrobactrum sp. MYb29]PRA90613.1 ABC transporter ATP-binding protein [
MSFLKITDLYKSYGNVSVLKDINIEIEEGGFLVLVGPSGCGKSTLLNTIAGLEPITSGDILINDRSVSGLHPSQRDIAMVFQSYALYPNMTVAGNIAFGMEIRKVPKPEREKAIQEVADILQIGHLLDRKPSQLSGGQRQRVAMGRALVRNPQVFLFDEPLSNLDAKLRVDMRTEIKRLHHRMKTTIVYVTHDQIEAMTLATKIAVLKDGILQQFGTPAEIYNNPANMFVADFMGSPAMNLLHAGIEKNGSELAVVLEQGEGETLKLPLKTAPQSLGEYVGKQVMFGIRPEALTDPDGADRNAHSVVEGECLIDVVEPAGSDTFAVTRIGGKQVVARLRADARIVAGQRSRLAFNLDKSVFFDPSTQGRIL